MKAFLVMDSCEEHQQIIFADKRSKAIADSEAYGNSGEYIEIRATRMPHLFQYAERGYVPKQALLKDGWWFECSGYKQEPKRRCCQRLTVEDNPLIVNELTYCSVKCLTEGS